MISPLMVSSKNVKVSQKRRLGTAIESFTGSSPSEQIIGSLNEPSPCMKQLCFRYEILRFCHVTGFTELEKIVIVKVSVSG